MVNFFSFLYMYVLPWLVLKESVKPEMLVLYWLESPPGDLKENENICGVPSLDKIDDFIRKKNCIIHWTEQINKSMKLKWDICTKQFA